MNERQLQVFEQGVQKKYGHDALSDPNDDWTVEKEKEYLKQLQGFVNKQERYRQVTEVKVDEDVLIRSKLLNRKNKLEKCGRCEERCRTIDDDVTMTKYDCCFKCYINFIEDRNNKDG